jgi:hypothetical protein
MIVATVQQGRATSAARDVASSVKSGDSTEPVLGRKPLLALVCDCTFSEARGAQSERQFSADFDGLYASPYRKFESHSLRHLVSLL